MQPWQRRFYLELLILKFILIVNGTGGEEGLGVTLITLKDMKSEGCGDVVWHGAAVVPAVCPRGLG